MEQSELGWTQNALCREMGSRIFFPEGNDRLDPHKAIQICRRCPVMIDCRLYALDNEDYGIWGGMTPYERRAMRRRLYGKDRTLIHVNKIGQA